MPTYEYKCLECGNLFELFQKMTAEPVTTCPLCLGHVKRLISGGSGPLFKGTGFYHTDYKMVNKKSETKQEAKSEKKADTK